MAEQSQIDELTRRIVNTSSEASVGSVISLIGDTFQQTFGTTTDVARLLDIFGEAHEFHRAPTRHGRLEELGDLYASLGAFCCEQDVDPVEYIKATLLKILKKHDLYASRGDKRDVAVFGLSGDPPHLGHIALAQTVLDVGAAHEVWYMFANEYCGSKSLTPASIRLQMGELLPQVDPRHKPFDFEIRQGLFSETVNTMLKLVHSELAATQRFKFVISVELANSIPTWPRWEELIRVVPFITVPRIGHTPDLRNPWFLQYPHRYIDIRDAPRLIDVSSTKVKALYRARKFKAARKLMHPLFHDFVMKNGLYQQAA